VSRAVEEWIGKTDDTPAPPRVQLRVFLKFDGHCQCGCGIKIDNKPWQTDHRLALINGGENRESNLQPLLVDHHKTKTRADVALKSADRKTQLHHYGIKQSRNPMPGSRRSKFKKKMNGQVELR
jgi:5-methylcytosine-specific restriction protein A